MFTNKQACSNMSLFVFLLTFNNILPMRKSELYARYINFGKGLTEITVQDFFNEKKRSSKYEMSLSDDNTLIETVFSYDAFYILYICTWNDHNGKPNNDLFCCKVNL